MLNAQFYAIIGLDFGHCPKVNSISEVVNMTAAVLHNPAKQLAECIHLAMSADTVHLADVMVETVAILKLCRGTFRTEDVAQVLPSGDVLTADNNPFTPRRLVNVVQDFKSSAQMQGVIQDFTPFFFAVLLPEDRNQGGNYWWEVEEQKQSGGQMWSGFSMMQPSVYLWNRRLSLDETAKLFSGVVRGGWSFPMMGNVCTTIYTEEQLLNGLDLGCGVSFQYHPYISETDTLAYGGILIPTLEKWVVDEVMLLNHSGSYDAVRLALSQYKRERSSFDALLKTSEKYSIRKELEHLIEIREQCCLLGEDDCEYESD